MTSNVIKIHLTTQTLLAAHRFILSQTFEMIEKLLLITLNLTKIRYKPLLKRLIIDSQYEIIVLYSVYQFWYKNPLVTIK